MCIHGHCHCNLENGCCKPFVKFIKDFDIFGHPIKLNFNKNGSTHKTMIGGFTSLIFYVAVVFVILFIVFDIGKEKDGKIIDPDALDGSEASDLHAADDTVEEPDPDPVINYEPIKGTGP